MTRQRRGRAQWPLLLLLPALARADAEWALASWRQLLPAADGDGAMSLLVICVLAYLAAALLLSLLRLLRAYAWLLAAAAAAAAAAQSPEARRWLAELVVLVPDL